MNAETDCQPMTWDELGQWVKDHPEMGGSCFCAWSCSQPRMQVVLQPCDENNECHDPPNPHCSFVAKIVFP